jgi:uncharacterized protein YgiM (DUF1202 family)
MATAMQRPQTDKETSNGNRNGNGFFMSGSGTMFQAKVKVANRKEAGNDRKVHKHDKKQFFPLSRLYVNRRRIVLSDFPGGKPRNII